MRILLVDDHSLFLESLRMLLVTHGVAIAGTARDGWEALAQARALHPDVILMDIQMPRCNGLEATRLIKAELPDIQIVILTASDTDEDLFEAIKSGAAGYLLKSLTTQDLLALLEGLAHGEPPSRRAWLPRSWPSLPGARARPARPPRIRQSQPSWD